MRAKYKKDRIYQFGSCSLRNVGYITLYG